VPDADRSEPVERLLSDWLARYDSARTRDAYGRDLARFAAWLAFHHRGLLEASRHDVARYAEDLLAAGASAATVRRRLAAISAFFAHAAQAGRVSTNPGRGADRPAATTATGGLSPAECARVTVAAEQLGPRAALVVALLLYDGLKLAEVLGLDAADVDGGRLFVERRVGRQPVELDPRTITALARYVAGRRHGPLVMAVGGGARGRLSRFGAHAELRDVGRRAGLGVPLTSNRLRASFVANAHARGMSVRMIGYRAGHADPRTTHRLLPPRS
jgi:integrase/recombinase XerC